MKAKGRPWHKKGKVKRIEPKKPFDREAEWGYSEAKDEWIYGYGIHLSVVATPNNPVLPFSCQLTTANQKGLRILEQSLSKIPQETKYLVADKEFDCQRIYQKSEGKLVTPIRETRNWKTKKRAMSEKRRKRKEFFKSPEGQRLYRLRNSTVEQLFNIIKNVFKVEPSWLFGKNYTETLVLTAVWAYQIFVAYSLYNHLPYQRIQKIKPFLDRL